MKIISDAAAYRLAGPSAPRFVAGGVQVLMRPDGAAVLITEAPERLEHHRRAGEVVLPWQPAEFDEDTRLLLKCFDGLRCRVLLWLPEGLVDLGWGRGSLRSTHPLPGRAAVIILDGPVDWEELDLQRSLLVPVAEPAPIGWLEHVLTDRRRALRELVAGWFPRRLRPAWRPEFQAPPQIAVPSGLADFYRLAHHHPDLLGRRYHGGFLYPSAELEVDQSGRIRLGWAGDHGPGWRLAPGGDDPQVLAVQHEEIRDDQDGWLSGIHQRAPWREREPLSGFLLQFALYVAAAYGPYRGVASRLSRRRALALIDGWRHVPLQPLLAEWEPVTFAVAPGRIACLYPGPPEYSAPDVDDCWVSVAATHPGLLNPWTSTGTPSPAERATRFSAMQLRRSRSEPSRGPVRERWTVPTTCSMLRTALVPEGFRLLQPGALPFHPRAWEQSEVSWGRLTLTRALAGAHDAS